VAWLTIYVGASLWIIARNRTNWQGPDSNPQPSGWQTKALTNTPPIDALQNCVLLYISVIQLDSIIPTFFAEPHLIVDRGPNYNGPFLVQNQLLGSLNVIELQERFLEFLTQCPLIYFGISWIRLNGWYL
jgi:hypothetical protein